MRDILNVECCYIVESMPRMHESMPRLHESMPHSQKSASRFFAHEMASPYDHTKKRPPARMQAFVGWSFFDDRMDSGLFKL